jgi:hypothetical protein
MKNDRFDLQFVSVLNGSVSLTKFPLGLVICQVLRTRSREQNLA